MNDYDDLYRKSLRTAESAFGPKDPDELATTILTKTELTRDDLAHILTRALLDVVAPDQVANLEGLRAEMAEAMYNVAHDNCGEGEPCSGEDYGKYVDDVLMSVVEKYAVKAEVAPEPAAANTDLHLNQPMVKRLRACAADTSSNWEGAVTVYPPEARGLVALIDQVSGNTAVST